MSVITDPNLELSANNFPYSSLNNVELNNLNCSDTTNFWESLPNFDIVTEVSKFSNIQSEVDLSN